MSTRNIAYTTTGVVIASGILGALALAAFLQAAAEALSDWLGEEELVMDTQRNGGVKAGRRWVAR